MEFVVKMPDVGEGVAEAELVEWNVKLGDPISEDMIVAAVMTDKATVEIPSPVSGTIIWLGGEIGDKIAVKAPLLKIDVAGDGTQQDSTKADGVAMSGRDSAAPSLPEEVVSKAAKTEKSSMVQPTATAQPVSRGGPDSPKPLASPAVRLRALEAGIDLRRVRATGPAKRITHDDLDRHDQEGLQTPGGAKTRRKTGVSELKVAGLRRRIAEKMVISASHIPHITYVEEVDMTALETLRASLNSEKHAETGKLTILPFLMKAITRAIEDHPAINALYDEDRSVVLRHEAVHIGIATQTPSGLMVPVVRHVEARRLRDCSSELNRISQAARDGSATRDELTGSTITISSLGALGGLVSTPIINHPEVAIIGVNKLTTKPHWDGSQFLPRKFMNLSSSFDHRIIDGWDAAMFIQRVKVLLENPALIFLED